MSIKSFYPLKDSTIYFYSGSYLNSLKNTGQDSILELSKASGYNYSRTLIQFNTTDISNYLSDNNLHLNNTQSYSTLKIFNAVSQEIPESYNVEIYPLSQSWDNGIGKFNYSPQETGGVNWYYRTTNLPWSTAGGTYYNIPFLTQSFELDSLNNDINVNITDILLPWVSSSIPNYGMILKRSTTDENTLENRGNIKFFAKNTNTIYQPRLDIYTNDKVYSFTTDSVLQHYTGSKQVEIISDNIKSEYYYTDTARINFYFREKYPRVTFVSSFDTIDSYDNLYRLPVTCSYKIVDTASNETVYDFDYNYMGINNDENNSYINIDMNNLSRERYYSISFKYVMNNITVYDINNTRFLFKLI